MALSPEEVNELIAAAGVVRRPCDLDLLVFFRRHPRSLLASEQLALYVGYEPAQVARSLETLLGAGLVTRSQNPGHAGRLYVLATEGAEDRGLARLLGVASTREGRNALIRALQQQAAGAGAAPEALEPRDA
jgi:DNA-binding MarR family transcriptional regulator